MIVSIYIVAFLSLGSAFTNRSVDDLTTCFRSICSLVQKPIDDIPSARLVPPLNHLDGMMRISNHLKAIQFSCLTRSSVVKMNFKEWKFVL